MARFPEGPGEQPCQQRQSMSPKSLRTGFGTTICESKAYGTYASYRIVYFAPKRSLHCVKCVVNSFCVRRISVASCLFAKDALKCVADVHLSLENS